MRPFLAALMLCVMIFATVAVISPYDGHGPIGQGFDRTPILANSYRPGMAGEEPGLDVDVAEVWQIPAGTVVAVDLPRPRPPNLLAKAEQYIGTNPTGWGSLWCARFIAMLAPDLANRIDNPNWARDWAELPRVKPRPGVIVVLSRGKAGHIGVLKSIDRKGNPIIVSGNTAKCRHCKRIVDIGKYPKHRVLAYVNPGLL